MSHKEVLNTHKVEMLKEAKRQVVKNGKNEIRLNDLKYDINLYCNFQKLRLHSVVFKVKRGTWGITAHGWDFLRGDRDLPKFVWVDNNKIQAHSQELVNIRDLNNGEVVIEQTFEYADGSKRPTIDARQVVLL